MTGGHPAAHTQPKNPGRKIHGRAAGLQGFRA